MVEIVTCSAVVLSAAVPLKYWQLPACAVVLIFAWYCGLQAARYQAVVTLLHKFVQTVSVPRLVSKACAAYARSRFSGPDLTLHDLLGSQLSRSFRRTYVNALEYREGASVKVPLPRLHPPPRAGATAMAVGVMSWAAICVASADVQGGPAG